MLEGGGPAACPPRRSHGNGSAASHFVPYATSCPLCFCCGGHWGKERASGFSQAWPRATRRTLKAEGGWSCPPQREVGWWEALCKALPAGMGCSRRGEAKREAGSVPAWQRPLGSRLRGVPAPSPLLRALGVGVGGVCPLRAWKHVQGGEWLPALSRDGANAGVGCSEVRAGPGRSSPLQPRSLTVIAVN